MRCSYVNIEHLKFFLKLCKRSSTLVSVGQNALQSHFQRIYSMYEHDQSRQVDHCVALHQLHYCLYMMGEGGQGFVANRPCCPFQFMCSTLQDAKTWRVQAVILL